MLVTTASRDDSHVVPPTPALGGTTSRVRIMDSIGDAGAVVTDWGNRHHGTRDSLGESRFAVSGFGGWSKRAQNRTNRFLQVQRHDPVGHSVRRTTSGIRWRTAGRGGFHSAKSPIPADRFFLSRAWGDPVGVTEVEPHEPSRGSRPDHGREMVCRLRSAATCKPGNPGVER